MQSDPQQRFLGNSLAREAISGATGGYEGYGFGRCGSLDSGATGGYGGYGFESCSSLVWTAATDVEASRLPISSGNEG